MSVPEKIWYAYSGAKYDGILPAYFDPAKIPGLKEFESRHQEINHETELLINGSGDEMQMYFNRSLVDGDWRVLHLINWGVKNEQVLSRFPVISSLLKQVPLVTSAAISRLQSCSRINPHIGDTNAVVRCHFGLKIPSKLPECGLEVNGEKRSWKEGEWVAFCDAHEHSAWNNSSEARYVLIIDILLPEYESEAEDVCRNVRSILMLQATLQRKPWMRILPGKILGLIRRVYKRSLRS